MRRSLHGFAAVAVAFTLFVAGLQDAGVSRASSRPELIAGNRLPGSNGEILGGRTA
jgi:hypothetical protein